MPRAQPIAKPAEQEVLVNEALARPVVFLLASRSTGEGPDRAVNALVQAIRTPISLGGDVPCFHSAVAPESHRKTVSSLSRVSPPPALEPTQ
jgi:hypothetical protein